MKTKIYMMNRLNNLKKGLFFSLAMLSMMVISSCTEDEGEPDPTMTLYELIAADSELTTLKAFVDSDTELRGFLEGTTNYTLFAPTNEAFEILAETLAGTRDIAALNAVNPTLIGNVLRFHFGIGDISSADLAGAEVPTAFNEDITVNGDGTIQDGGRVTAVAVVNADIRATNGRIHKVGNILVPQSLFIIIGTHLGKVTQAIFLGADFTVLLAAITKAETYAATSEQIPSLLETLTGTTAYTLLVPSDLTFAGIPTDAPIPGPWTVDTFTAEQWYGIISNHVVAGAFDVEDFTTCATFTSLAGVELEVFHNTDVLAANNGVGIYFDSDMNVDCTLADEGASLQYLNAELALANAFTPEFGKFHVIAGVLTPPMQ